MTTVSEIGISKIKKGMCFKDPNSSTVDRYEAMTEVQQGFSGDYIDISIHYTDNTIATTKWFDYEVCRTGWAGGFELIEEEVKPSWTGGWMHLEPPTEPCYHYNKKKVIVFNLSGYWMCENCKADLGNLTEEEFYQAVKEQTGGKECKRGPDFGQSRRRR